jgi:zinc protease
MRARALAEIAGQDASWNGQAFRYFKQQFFGPRNSPYQFIPLGSGANVSRFSAEDLRSWYQGTILTAPRVIAIFGDVDNETAVAMARKYFSAGQLTSPPKQAMPQEEPAASPGKPTVPPAKPTVVVDWVAVQKTDQELAGVVIGFESQSRIGEPDEAGLIVAQCLTGGYGYPTGYIFETLRGQGWSYEAASQNVPGRGHGLDGDFMVYAACDPRNVNKVTNAILQNMARLQGSEADIQADWFARCKEMIATAYALETETPEEQAEIAATEELFGLGYDYHEGFSGRINAVTLGQVQELGRTRLEHCVVTVCTPAPEIVDIHSGPNVYDSFPAIDLTPRGVRHDVGGK